MGEVKVEKPQVDVGNHSVHERGSSQRECGSQG